MCDLLKREREGVKKRRLCSHTKKECLVFDSTIITRVRFMFLRTPNPIPVLPRIVLLPAFQLPRRRDERRAVLAWRFVPRRRVERRAVLAWRFVLRRAAAFPPNPFDLLRGVEKDRF